MDKFTKAEIEGRKIVYDIISGHCDECYFTPTRYDEVDLFITGRTGKEVVMEIKNRPEYTSTQIDELGGHIIEYNKFTALTSYDRFMPLYAMAYQDALLMWNVSGLTDDRFHIEKDKYPATTVGNNRNKKEKKVAYLKRDECCAIIKRNNNDEYNG